MKYFYKYLVDFMVLGIIYILIFYKRWKVSGRDTLFINTMMYVYLSFVLYFTLMPIVTSIPFIFNHPYTLMNMEPFIDVSLGRGDFMRQVGLNVIMTIPFGFLFPLTKKENSSFFKSVLYCAILSLSIELLQPLINGFRSADITDLITNVTGGVIGYVFYLIFRPLTSRILKFIKDSNS